MRNDETNPELGKAVLELVDNQNEQPPQPMKTLITSLLMTLTLSSFSYSATVLKLEFNTDGTMPRSEVPSLEYYTTQFEEAKVYSVSDGLLHQRTYGINGSAAYAWPNVNLTGGTLSAAMDTVLEARLRALRVEGVYGAYCDAFDGVYRYSFSIAAGGVHILTSSGHHLIPFTDITNFHVYRLTSPGDSSAIRFFIDSNLVYEGIAPARNLNGFAWGDGDLTLGYGADVDWDYVGVSQNPTVRPFTVTIEVSEFRVCWDSRLNKTYQPQYRSEVTGQQWVNLGAPQTGNGSTNCITDAAAGPRRFYQVVELP